MRIACISDTHNHYVEMESCDLIIHAGDAFHAGKNPNLNLIQWEANVKRQFARWREIAPVIYVPGNHDILLETHSLFMREEFRTLDINILDHNRVNILGLEIFGTPVQPMFGGWAFNYNDRERKEKFAHVTPCDILVTHCPPYGILDETDFGDHVGCWVLGNKVKELNPRYHCFGHIHHSRGQIKINDTTHINCAVTDESYRLAHKPIYIEL